MDEFDMVQRQIVATYPYTDAKGKLLFEVVRFEPKDFRQRTPDGNGGWHWGLNGTAPVLYRFDKLATTDPASSVAFIAEGEKDVHSLERLGLLATTAPMGAGKWRPAYSEALRGFHVFIFADNDDAGRKHAEEVAKALSGIAASVTIVELPGLPPKGDVSDWLAAESNDRAKLLALCEEARKQQRFQFTPGDAWEQPDDRLPRPSANGKHTVPSQTIGLDPFVPFPVETLPEPLHSFAQEAAKALGVEAAFVALPVLATVAGCIGATRVLELKRTWREPPILWTSVVADSGTVKTPAREMATNPVYRVQAEHRKAYRRQLSEYREHTKKRKDEPQPEPVYKRVITSDTTIEKVASSLEENPRGLLVSNDELGAWLSSFARYKGKAGGSDLPQWLSMHRGGPIIVDRKTGPSLFVERGVVSITGTIQPGTLAAALSQQFFDAGLPARLLLAMPPKQPKKWSEVEVSPDVGQAYRDSIAALLSLTFDGEPQVVGMSSEAKSVWVRFYDDWAQEQAASEGELLAAFAKLEAYAARFGLVHHVVMHLHLGIEDAVPLSAESMNAGVELARWFGNEARRIYSMLAETDEQRARRHLVEFIQARGGRITARELQRSNNRKYRTADDAHGALCGLVNDGLAQWVAPEEGAKGRPTRILELTMHDP